MAKEERYITFDLNEIYLSVKFLSEKDGASVMPPKGIPKALGMRKEGANNIYLTVHNAATGQEETLEYDQKFFSMALVLLCQANKIPLPRDGKKTLKVLQDRIIMEITLESITTPQS